MRPIKFRGLKDGVWYVLDFSHSQAWARDLLKLMAEGQGTFRFDSPLCEFTGRLDRNGREIYEGDTLRRISDKKVFFVGWNSPRAQWLGYDIRTTTTMIGDRKFEVIGNIHENPELLE